MHMDFERPLDGTRVQLVVQEVDYERPIPCPAQSASRCEFSMQAEAWC